MRYLMIAAALVATIATIGTANAEPYEGRAEPCAPVNTGYAPGVFVEAPSYVAQPVVYTYGRVPYGRVYGRGVYRRPVPIVRPGHRSFRRW